MTLGNIKVTAHQFFQLSEDPVGVRLELVQGEIKANPSLDFRRSNCEMRLGAIVGRHVEDRGSGALFGDVGIILGEFDVRRSNLIYFRKTRFHLIGEKAMEGPPDLCVEVVSPSSVTTDRKLKFKQYEKGKVAHYWIVDPAKKTIQGYKLVGGKYRLTGEGKDDDVVRLPPFAELDIQLGELWWRRP